MDGLWAHATHFVVLFALGATLLLLRWREHPKALKLMGSGVLYGVAFVMKQPGILFTAFGGLYVIYSGKKQWRQIARDLAVFSVSAALPLAFTCVILWRMGVFAKFWFWVFRYASQYVSNRSFSAGVEECIRQGTTILAFNPVLCLVAALGLVQLWRYRELRTTAMTITGFLLISWLAVCPGLYFRPHYFVLVLPAVALLIGAVAASAGATLARSLPLWIIAFGLANSMWAQRGYLFQMSPVDVVRGVYGLNPFAEAIPVAEYIRAHTESGDQLAVLGSEPEIYFYSGRRSVTPYLYVEPLVERQPLAPQMREEFIDDIEAWKPRYLVFASSPDSWGSGEDRAPELMAWAKTYYQQNYTLVGIADVGEDGTTYKWDSDAATYRIESGSYVLVLKRK